MKNPGYLYSGLMPDWLAARATLAPQDAALVARPRAGPPVTQLTFGELDRRATLTARRLAALGLEHGDRVALLLRDGAATAAFVHGAGRAGAVIVPLNLRLTPAELAWQLGDSAPALLVYDEASREAGEAAARDAGLPAERVLDLGAFEQIAPATVALRERINLAALHTIIYTSGTTGRPKGALLTYGNHWWNAVGSALNLGLHQGDRWLVPLPLFHVGGLSVLMRGAIYGIPAVVHEAFDPAAVNEAIDAGATIVSVVATMLRRMLDARGDVPYPSTLRYVLLGGGPAPRPLLEDCAVRGMAVVQTYGLTETASQAVTLPPADALRKLGSAGKPLLPNELRIVSDGAEAAPGAAGEIVLRGPSVTPGYFRRPKETARALRDGWLHTGDLGYRDDDGYLYVLDRRDDLIISGGENVYPAEVEAVLLAHPAVADAGVVGVDDATWGRVPVAFVVLRDEAAVTGDDLIAFCRDRLARYKVPGAIHLCEALPRNAAGKLQRHLLGRSLP